MSYREALEKVISVLDAKMQVEPNQKLAGTCNFLQEELEALDGGADEPTEV